MKIKWSSGMAGLDMARLLAQFFGWEVKDCWLRDLAGVHHGYSVLCHPAADMKLEVP